MASRVGRGIEGGTGQSCYETNQQCHGRTDGVEIRKDAHVIKKPKIYAIYWDEYFSANPQAVYTMNQFFREILTSSYMSQLRQYNEVGQGEFLGSTVIVPDPENPPPAKPAELTPDAIQLQLIKWLREEKLPKKPRGDETELLYVIFTPTTTNFGDCLAGCHASGRYDERDADRNHKSSQDNLFWAAIQEWHYNGPPASPREFADSCTWAVSHEMVEAFTNRDGNGIHTDDGCEIADICECAAGTKDKKTPIIKAEVDGWAVETYWDQENKSCYPLHILPADKPPVGGGYAIPKIRKIPTRR
jgi:hypothetical protein